MSFINWGNENPEQLRLRKRLEEEAIFEQFRMAQLAALSASAGSGGNLPPTTTTTTTALPTTTTTTTQNN
jgi:hypothetical protein